MAITRAVDHGEVGHRHGLAVALVEQAGSAVDQHDPRRHRGTPAERARAPCDRRLRRPPASTSSCRRCRRAARRRDRAVRRSASKSPPVRGAGPRLDQLALADRVVGAGGVSAGVCCTRRRARLASWRVASTLRSTIGAISSNGRPKLSWSTKASRSSGGSVSSTTSRASPTLSASTAALLRVAAVGGGDDRIGDEHVERLLGVGPPLPQAVEADPAGDGGQPAADVGDARPGRPGRSGTRRPAPRRRPR